MQKTIILDFDSTFINCETLDTLAHIIYQHSAELTRIVTAVEAATNATMAGEMGIHESLVSRIKMLNIQKKHVLAGIDYLRQKVSDSFIRNKIFIQDHADDIFIFSGGFSEIIIPIVADFNIASTHVFANNFIYSGDLVTNIDENCLLAHNFGKAKQLEMLNRSGKVFVIGDGATDAEIKAMHPQVRFYLYTENVFRKNLANSADKIISSLAEFVEEFDGVMPQK